MVNTIRDILIVGLSMAAQVRGFAPASTHRPRSHQSRPREVAPVEIGEVSDTMLMTGGAAAAIVATPPLWLKALAAWPSTVCIGLDLYFDEVFFQAEQPTE